MSLETQSFQFGDFLLDVKEKVLLRHQKPVPITPKTFLLLQTLVENHGHLVEKDQLMKTVWPDSFVEEGNLSFTINLLRKALNDNKQDPRFVETVPKRGYRFIAEVRRVASEHANSRTADGAFLRQLNAKDNAAPKSGHSGNQALGHHSGAVVALADWRHDAAESESNESDSEKSNAKTAKLELVPATPFIAQKRNNYILVFAGVISVIVLTGFGYGLYHLLNRADSPASLSNPTRLTSNGKTKAAAVSPDGRFVAYVISDEGQESIWLKDVATDSDILILPPAEDTVFQSLTFSPDGNFIYYGAKGTLWQLPILGGLAKKILENFGSGTITFSPDAKQFAFMRFSGDNESAIFVTDADGTGERMLASSKRPDIFVRSAAWSPDGKIIACVMRTSAAPAENVVAAVRVSDGVISSIPSPQWTVISQITWQPDGRNLFVVATEGRSSISHQIWSLSYPGGEAKNITNDLNNYLSISRTSDGDRLVAVRMEQESHIWAMASESASQAKQLTNGIDSYNGIWGLNYLGNGKIVYEVMPKGAGEVWTMDSNGRNAKQILDESGSMGASPDGKYLVFQSKNADGVGLFRINLNDGEKTRLTTGADVWSTFSPDGNWIVFTRWAEQVALWKISIDGGEAAKLTNVTGAPVAPAISPDGKLIAFYWDKNRAGESPEIALLPFDGGPIEKTFSLPIQYSLGFAKKSLQWTPDGHAISYSVLRRNVANIWRQPIDGSPPFQVTNFESGRIFNFSYSPDGRQLALSRGTFNRDVVLIKTSR